MIKLFKRRTRIVVERVRRKKSPFIYKSHSPKSKHRHLRKRKAAELRFRRAGVLCIVIAFLFLVSLGWNIITSGYSALTEAQIHLPVHFDSELVEELDYRTIVQNALLNLVPEVQQGDEAEIRKHKRALFAIVSRNAPHMLRKMVQEDASLIGTRRKVWIPASSTVSIFHKRHVYKQAERSGKLTPAQASWVIELTQSKQMMLRFNRTFFTHGDSREAEGAGVLASTVGSFLTIIVCITMAFPLGVATAIYLEEFARKSWFTDFIEININNLAAVPSIIFGLLGLAIYLNLFGLPRSSSLVGGMVLALLILPVIVIATRNALQAVPPSIRYAAAALGATPVQVVFHHTFIYALPGIMTGVILSIARAFGETAPLLMIGMVAFIVDVPKGLTDPATSLPVQVYLWSNNPELGFIEKTSAAILVLLGFMVLINLLAIYIRRRYEIKW